MEEDLLRDEIYRRLGLEKGSLSSESGNDWERAKNEVLEEWKRKEFENNEKLKEIDYSSIDKNTNEFKFALTSASHKLQDYKISIAQRNDLSEEDILQLIEHGNKEVIINLTRHQILSEEVISKIIPNSVYLAKKYLVEKQNLSNTQKETLLKLLQEHEDSYKDLIYKLQSTI